MTATHITAIDVKAEARALARELGADATVDPTSEDVVAGVDAITDGAHQIKPGKIEECMMNTPQ
jgi:Zn-dependent alcohol dehydrogenase